MKETTPKKTYDRDFIRVGKSRIEGTGVFAKRNIPKGTRIIEYMGMRKSLSRLLVEISEGNPTHIYTFRLSEHTVIDGALNGNDARFINHSCTPNCEAYTFDDKVYIYAMRDIKRGEELSYDYHLGTSMSGGRKQIDKSLYVCRCGSPNCKGTMISEKKQRARTNGTQTR